MSSSLALPMPQDCYYSVTQTSQYKSNASGWVLELRDFRNSHFRLKLHSQADYSTWKLAFVLGDQLNGRQTLHPVAAADTIEVRGISSETPDFIPPGLGKYSKPNPQGVLRRRSNSHPLVLLPTINEHSRALNSADTPIVLNQTSNSHPGISGNKKMPPDFISPGLDEYSKSIQVTTLRGRANSHSGTTPSIRSNSASSYNSARSVESAPPEQRRRRGYEQDRPPPMPEISHLIKKSKSAGLSRNWISFEWLKK
ncbi:hypothetical protein HK100_011328 [Physocladia obscura]|uniref:Uncharacterized protein n=1 Tax=Physocladia obscura TaxID=109957 RepID=A0AAD5T9I2_9FUNG|nr:hypothetical protein HK100_011328 [Physocladia obscura]